MLIPIRSGAADDDDDTPQEWSLLELNGELIPPPGGTSTVANTTSGTGGTRMELGSVRFALDVSQGPCYNVYVHCVKLVSVAFFALNSTARHHIAYHTPSLFLPAGYAPNIGSSSHGKYITIND